MAKRILVAAALILATALPSRALPGAPVVTRMGNGLTVIVQEDHTVDLVGVNIWVKAGSSNETPNNNGVSHLIEHMVFGATTKRKSGDMDREMESIGATLDARTSRDWAHFGTTVSSRYLSQALDVLADAVARAQFLESDLRRERAVILDELAKKHDNPAKVLKDYLAAELYGLHPYALPIEGTRETIGKITRDDILNYYHKYYVPGNMAIVLVGDLNMQRAVNEVGKAFQSLSTSQTPEPPPQVTPLAKQINKAFHEQYKLTFIGIGFLGPPASETADVCATDVMLTYLGLGYHSWMADELKTKLGLADVVTADFLTQRYPGMIAMVAGCAEGNVQKVKGAMFAKIASLGKEGVTPDELAAAKRSLLSGNAFDSETFGGTANSYGFYYAISNIDLSTKYTERVQAVTHEDIMRVARTYLDPARAAVVVVSPSAGGSE